MSTSIEIRKDRILRNMENLEQELIRLNNLPDEPEVEGDFLIIGFERVIGRQKFTYAAIKAGGLWWLSGKREDFTSGMSWERLIEKLTSWGVNVDELWLATTWELV